MKAHWRISVFFRQNIETPSRGSNIESSKEKVPQIDPKKETQNLNQEILGGITNKDFLSVDRADRLTHLTNPSVDWKKIVNGQSIEFKFSFNGKINTNLYLKTTAGQLLPPTVREVTNNGVVWTRSSIYGEFFNAQWARLVIHDKTQITCSKVIDEEEVKALESKIIADNDKYKSDSDYLIILECAKRNIPYDVAKDILSAELRKNGNTPNIVDIEILITQLERTKDSFAQDFPNITIQKNNILSPEFLSYFVAFNNIKLWSQISDKFGITTEMTKTYSVIGSVRVSGSYGTNAPLSDTVKLMWELNWTESIALARKIFHPGPATDLLIKLDDWDGTMIKRMIALGYHEGWLKFGRQNPDPASGYNYWTFQIGWSKSTPESSMRKYEECMRAGIALAKRNGIDVSMETIVDPGQKDLITHLGYIDSQRGWANTFAMLRDKNLSDWELIHLMSTKIQGWIDAIWKSVVAQMQHTKIDTTTLTA